MGISEEDGSLWGGQIFLLGRGLNYSWSWVGLGEVLVWIRLYIVWFDRRNCNWHFWLWLIWEKLDCGVPYEESLGRTRTGKGKIGEGGKVQKVVDYGSGAACLDLEAWQRGHRHQFAWINEDFGALNGMKKLA